MKKYFFIILAFIFGLTAVAQLRDDVKHFYAGFFISAATTQTMHDLTHKKGLSIIAGTFVGIEAGIAKECIYDRKMQKGVYSNADILTTAWGSLCQVPVAIVAFDIDAKRKEKQQKQKLKQLKQDQ